MYCRHVFKAMDVLFIFLNFISWISVMLWSYQIYTHKIWPVALLTLVCQMLLCEVSIFVRFNSVINFFDNLQMLLIFMMIDHTLSTSNIIWPLLPSYIGLCFLLFIFCSLNIMILAVGVVPFLIFLLIFTGPCVLLAIYPFLLHDYLKSKFIKDEVVLLVFTSYLTFLYLLIFILIGLGPIILPFL